MRAALFVASLACAAFACLSAAPAAAQETRAQFLDRCRAETLAASPGSDAWVDEACAGRWPGVTRSNPMLTPCCRCSWPEPRPPLIRPTCGPAPPWSAGARPRKANWRA